MNDVNWRQLAKMADQAVSPETDVINSHKLSRYIQELIGYDPAFDRLIFYAEDLNAAFTLPGLRDDHSISINGKHDDRYLPAWRVSIDNMARTYYGCAGSLALAICIAWLEAREGEAKIREDTNG